MTDKGINKGTPLPMPVCCNICGKWFTDAKKAVEHAYKHEEIPPTNNDK